MASQHRNIKLTLEYDGTAFSGWQTQTPRASTEITESSLCRRTVQNEIEKVLQKIFMQKILIAGSGRTDSGVHALGQTANFKVRSSMPADEIKSALNANLPEEISVISAKDVKPDFHARYSVKSKIYRYTILNRNSRCSLQRNYCLYYPHKLNLQRMRREARSLIGRKDFKSFCATDPHKRKKGIKDNTVRTIRNLTIRKKGAYVIIDIEADGFLYKMVRNIVGTLLDVGRGKLKPGEMDRILTQKNRQAAGNTVKPKGLALLEVKY